MDEFRIEWGKQSQLPEKMQSILVCALNHFSDSKHVPIITSPWFRCLPMLVFAQFSVCTKLCSIESNLISLFVVVFFIFVNTIDGHNEWGKFPVTEQSKHKNDENCWKESGKVFSFEMHTQRFSVWNEKLLEIYYENYPFKVVYKIYQMVSIHVYCLLVFEWNEHFLFNKLIRIWWKKANDINIITMQSKLSIQKNQIWSNKLASKQCSTNKRRKKWREARKKSPLIACAVHYKASLKW